MTSLVEQDWEIVERALNAASDGASEPLYSQVESAKAALFRLGCVATTGPNVSADGPTHPAPPTGAGQAQDYPPTRERVDGAAAPHAPGLPRSRNRGLMHRLAIWLADRPFRTRQPW